MLVSFYFIDLPLMILHTYTSVTDTLKVMDRQDLLIEDFKWEPSAGAKNFLKPFYILTGTFHAKKTNRWRGQNLDFDQNWSVYWKIHKQFSAKFSDFSFN